MQHFYVNPCVFGGTFKNYPNIYRFNYKITNTPLLKLHESISMYIFIYENCYRLIIGLSYIYLGSWHQTTIL
jgi:hypothetical protein